MPEEILVDVNPFETRVALVVDGTLREVHVERPAAASLRGNLYRGKVVRVVGGVQAAFVDIGLGRPGFLHVRDFHGVRVEPGTTPPDIVKLVKPGQSLLVQVAKDPLNGKGVRLTTNLALAARTVVLLPWDAHVGVSARIVDEDERGRLKELVARVRSSLGQSYGYIARTACQSATEDQVRTEIEDLERLWKRVSRRYGESCRTLDAPTGPDSDARRANSCLVHEELPVPTRIVRDLAGPSTRAIVVNHPGTLQRLTDYIRRGIPELAETVRGYEGRTPLFEARGLEAAIDRALDTRVRLPSGGCLVIEQTEAMATIDVNSARFVDSLDLESTAFKTNLEAAREIPAQLRLRNIGGIIVVDFIDMADDDHRRAVMATLIDAASDDSARFRASGFSELGLVEISRRRTRESLEQQLCDTCEACAGRAWAKSPQSACYDIFRALQKCAAGSADGISEYLVRASQRVVDRLLDEEAPYLAALQRDVEHPIRLQVEPGYASDQFDLVLH
ncbi:MAG: Rne/Rng family ribonuclease [Gammaproteobacteria bacterium]|nr:Rne/Rng family ribonuclease [Gammaproteobacteria bacterium]